MKRKLIEIEFIENKIKYTKLYGFLFCQFLFVAIIVCLSDQFIYLHIYVSESGSKKKTSYHNRSLSSIPHIFIKHNSNQK